MSHKKKTEPLPPSPLRMVEFTQRAENGGHPIGNGGPFGHGKPLNVISARELWDLARAILPFIRIDKQDSDRQGKEQNNE